MKGGRSMIYQAIEFQASPFRYDLRFSDRITLVRGDSATGKTYLYQLLEDVKQLERYRDIRLQTRFWRRKTGASLILKKSNQYLLFARNCDGLNVSADSFTILQERDCVISLRKELVGA